MKTAYVRRLVLIVPLLSVLSCGDNRVAAPSLEMRRYSMDEDSDSDSDSDSESVRAPDLRYIARFKVTPEPPDPLLDHKLIGPEGGTLRVGDFEIIVPAGAVDRAINFRIRRPVDPRAAEHAYAEFAPHMEFRKPVTIRLPQANTNAMSHPYVMWWSGSKWVPQRTRVTEDGRVEAEVGHFSYYGTSVWGKGVTTLGG